MSYANLLLKILYHIVIEMNIRESCLQTWTFIYKPGISVTKQDFHLQTGILGLQMGFSGYYLPFVDVTIRYGVHTATIDRWKRILEIKEQFENQIGCSIYSLLPGIVENSFR